jgi:hypothetical protein
MRVRADAATASSRLLFRTVSHLFVPFRGFPSGSSLPRENTLPAPAAPHGLFNIAFVSFDSGLQKNITACYFVGYVRQICLASLSGFIPPAICSGLEKRPFRSYIISSLLAPAIFLFKV